MNYISKNISYLVEINRIAKDTLGANLGLKRGAVGSYMTGKSSPKLDTLIKISEMFNVTADDLLTKDLTSQKAKPTLSPESNNKNKGEQEMDNNFLQSQITTLVEALGKAQETINKQMESLNKQMEANAKQAELNQQLVEALTKRQAQPDYMNELEELKKRHDRTEQRFVALFARFNEQEKKVETTRKTGSA